MKTAHHMQDGKGYSGVFELTDTEAEQLRAKDWLVVPVRYVKQEVSGHLHVIDSRGQYVNTRMLDAVQAGDLVRQGYHLVHVGDGSKDMDEIRAIQKIHHQEEE